MLGDDAKLDGDVLTEPDPGFAPKDLSDRRTLGDWRSRYESAAWKHILAEATYLMLLLIAAAILLVVVWLKRAPATWHLSRLQADLFVRYAYAWLAGTLGGVLFGMKWLYHSVAKQIWHVDRALWRYLTPHISGGLAFATVVILNSITATGQGATSSGGKTVAIGFLVGFFSDNAVAKLAEVARTLLGPSSDQSESHSRQGRTNN
jgi:hypothetical protein